MTDDILLVDIDDRVALLTMNRPERRNALSQALVAALVDTVRRLDEDPAVHVLVLTGTDPAFCAGVDLKEWAGRATDSPATGRQAPERPDAERPDSERPDPENPAPERPTPDARASARNPWYGAFPPHRKPIVGAVNGPVATGGLEVALNCDLLVASERAAFADTHARVRVMPGWGMTVLLAQRIGVARAKEMSLTGSFVDAPTAHSWGLVNHVVPHGELLPAALRIAREMADTDHASMLRMRQTYEEISATTVAEAWAIEQEVSVAWEGQGYDPSAIEARRQEVLTRSHRQFKPEGDHGRD